MQKLLYRMAVAAIAVALLAGCNGDPPADSQGDDVELPSSEQSIASEPGNSSPDSYAPSGSSVPPAGGSSLQAMGNDWSEVDGLPTKSLDWGPGGPVDSQNRSQSALAYNEKYGKYNASFIGNEENTVYLTFDEGYEYGLTGSILDTLRDKQVRAVFFITHDFANRSGELVQRMIDEGHIVGNHSYSHKNYSTLTPKQMADDMMKMHDFIREKFDYEMKYFRYPSGNFNEQSLAVVQKMGYRTLFWSFAYKDWEVDNQPEPASSCDKMVKAACPGNIYLLHAVSSTNDKVMAEFIDRVRDAGFCWGDPATL